MAKRSIFSSVKLPGLDSNKFDLSHDFKFTGSMGEAIPTCVAEVLPGDKWTVGVENMIRFQPMIAPVMHRIRCATRYFFVPSRLLWKEWPDFITGQSDVEHPYMSTGVGGAAIGSLANYIGIPTGVPNLEVNPMQLAAYHLIWDEYYRSQDLQSPTFQPLVPGNNTAYLADLLGGPLQVGWEHDFFTAALPFAQKGDAVQIPLTVGQVPVELKEPGYGARTGAWVGTDGTAYIDQSPVLADSGPVPLAAGTSLDTVGSPVVAYDPQGSLVVDVQADATDINTLRWAFRMQEWLERNARAGTRYVESLLAHWGTKSSDARLQRPEYIGGSKQNVVISEVLATAQSTEDGVAVGMMAGHGISVGGGNKFSYRAEEHGYIIGIMSVVPDTAYQQGLHRQFSRRTHLDYAWPTFAHLGEQEVKLKEVYADAADPEATFGYQSRYAEYKYLNSRVAGEMEDTLKFWHLGRIFDSEPALNGDFIACKPDTRIFAVTDPSEDHLVIHTFNNIWVNRKLPVYGIPQI